MPRARRQALATTLHADHDIDTFAVRADGADCDSPKRIVDAAVKRWGHIDIIINNAGTCDDSLLADLAHDLWDKIMDCNLRFPVFLIKEAIPYFGTALRIVNISSVLARMGSASTTACLASKAALEGVTRVLATELNQKYNVAINCVNPDPVATDMWLRDTSPPCRDPGCGVDIPAVCYSLSFAPNPGFTQVFPRQAEILNYIAKVASDYGVDKHTPHHIVPSTNYGISLHLKLAFRFIPGLLFLVRILTFVYMEVTFFYFRTTEVGHRKRVQARKLSTEYLQSKAPGKYWQLLTPTFEFGCKRRVFDQGYVDTLNRHDVRLTDERIVRVKEHSLVTNSGEEVRADIIILATGFSLTQYNVHVQGRNGKTRDQHWQEYGCKATFKSVAMHDFPNFFYVLGPNSGRLHTSALLSIESFVDLIAAVIRPVLEQRASCVQVMHTSEQAYTKALHLALSETVHDSSCSSYLIDKQSGKNWFVYPWDTLQLWLTTHWRVLRDWEYEPAGL
ncbi:short-chain dehydrogenase/reductase [Grosmannia clavigera kw1407]|uniref:Short-chain dehydrogenase/reductase n=1 Tax=Grosmannia clavigera (strain kw1407 / UAMH 11150) TaxID=655863 RepID=F0XB53_GROCL|nr:short-chain dehydrogenase/reductase [Grosmannia clavigera kw1407]EFX04994.1 short-chain dehydrogenase/reductase [Grosmannia clavigera kw1407]